jgi:uncharacterized membrane protein
VLALLGAAAKLTLSACLVCCSGAAATAVPTDGGALGDGDLASCVMYGPVGTQRPNCPNDLPPEDDCAAATPVYDDVVPIFAERCAVCHHAGGLETKFQFDTYAQIHDNAQTRTLILTQIYGCRMPPPCAPDLSTAERKTMLKWFVCGAPVGRDAGTD